MHLSFIKSGSIISHFLDNLNDRNISGVLGLTHNKLKSPILHTCHICKRKNYICVQGQVKVMHKTGHI